MFMLDDQLNKWRQNLLNDSQFKNTDIDELENHLKEQIQDFIETGLSEDEAFLLSAYRIGDTKSLSNEFKKINPFEIWRKRLIYMLIGAISFVLIEKIGNIIYHFTLSIGINLEMNLFIITVFSILIKTSLIVTLLLTIYSIVSDKKNKLQYYTMKGLNFIKFHPVLTLVLAIIIIIFDKLSKFINTFLMARYFDPASFGQYTFRITLFNLAISMIIPIILLSIVFGIYRKNKYAN